MTDSRTRPRHLRSVRTRFWLQVAAAVTVAACLILWSSGHYQRRDFSRSRSFELSGQSKEMMWFLKSPVRITVCFSPSSTATGSELYGDILALLREFQFYAHHYRDLTVEKLDPLRDPARAREFQAAHRFSGEENVLVIEYNGRSAVIPVPEMGEYDTAPTQYGEQPRLIAFRGEQVLDSVLLGLVEPESARKVYFLQGHGEGLPGLPPHQLAGQNLKRQNMTVLPLNLSVTPEVPKDASVLVILGALFDPSPGELSALRGYWKRGGNLLVLLDPTGDTPGLDAFLGEEGILPRNDRVLRLVNLGTATGILRDVTGEFYGGSEITSRLVGLNVLLPGNTRSLAINDQLKACGRTTDLPPDSTRPLIRAVHGFRGCSHFANAEGKGISFDPDKDLFFPVLLAAMTDLGGVHDDRLSLGASRMVVTGNSEFLKDKFLSGTALDFFSSSLNTLAGRTRMAGTTPKTKEFFTLNLDDQQLRFLLLWSMIAIPLAALIPAGIVLWRRRR